VYSSRSTWLSGVKSLRRQTALDFSGETLFERGEESEGFATMKAGVWHRLIMPSDLAYGSHGARCVVLPNAGLKLPVSPSRAHQR